MRRPANKSPDVRMKLAQRHRAEQEANALRVLFANVTVDDATTSIVHALRKKEAMLSSPDVSYSRPTQPKPEAPESNRNVRPPPKSFADFEQERKKGETAAPSKPAPSDAEERDHDNANLRQRLGMLEDRADHLDDALDQLTELVTSPKDGGKHEVIIDLVRLTIVDGAMNPGVCLFAIAKRLGIIPGNARLQNYPLQDAPVTLLPRKAPEVMAEPPEPPPTLPREAPVAHSKALPREAPVAHSKGRPRTLETPGVVDTERQKVIDVLAKHGLSQNAFAQSIGMHQGTLSRWLRGHGVQEKNIRMIAKGISKLEK